MVGDGDGRSTSSRDDLSSMAVQFIDEYFSLLARMNHIPPYLFPSREDDDDVRDIGKKRFLFGSTSPYRIFRIVKALYKK